MCEIETELFNNLHKPCMIKRKIKGERGKPCLNPRSTWQKPNATPFMRTLKETEVKKFHERMRETNMSKNKLKVGPTRMVIRFGQVNLGDNILLGKRFDRVKAFLICLNGFMDLMVMEEGKMFLRNHPG